MKVRTKEVVLGVLRESLRKKVSDLHYDRGMIQDSLLDEVSKEYLKVEIKSLGASIKDIREAIIDMGSVDTE